MNKKQTAKNNRNANYEDDADLRGRDSIPTCEEEIKTKEGPFPRTRFAVKKQKKQKKMKKQNLLDDSDMRGRDSP